MPFAVATVWREPVDHTNDCYFYMVSPVLKGLFRKKTWTVQYPNAAPALRPVPHEEGLPIPIPPESYSLETDGEEEED